MTKNGKRILTDSIKYKMNYLAASAGKTNLEALNFALDVAIAFERTKFELKKFYRAIENAKGCLLSLKYLIEQKRKRLNQ